LHELLLLECAPSAGQRPRQSAGAGGAAARRLSWLSAGAQLPAQPAARAAGSAGAGLHYGRPAGPSARRL